MKLKEFIREQKERHAVLAFGRMNPIHSGHELVVNKVRKVADKHGAAHHIVLSHTQDTEKNPLSPEQKIKHARRAFTGTNFIASSKEHPTFLKHAELLHKAGVTHLHMVGGGDRTADYKEKLNRYNGTGPGKLFNFKKITVHSSGDRDPDADDLEGMSASKMRKHVKNNDFESFKKGVPSRMSHGHAREMFNDVKRSLKLNEQLNESFEQFLIEGVHDAAIFKAVFLAGGPGSGKDFVLDNTLEGHGLTEVNSDRALEYLMDKKGLDKLMPAKEKAERETARGRAKDITELRQRLAIKGRNGLIINGTGDDLEKITAMKKRLEDSGYETKMVLVNTSDEVSQKRNIERGQRGGRTVPELIRSQKWQDVQNSRAEYAKLFGQNYHEIDNSVDLRESPPEVVKQQKDKMLDLFKNVQEFIKRPPSSEQAKTWVEKELSKKNRFTPGVKDETGAHPSSEAMSQAQRLGLTYMGFGRYGKNGKATHHSVHDTLEPIISDKAKKVNEEFELLAESLSDSGDLNLLLLGNGVQEVNMYHNNENDSYDVKEEKKSPNYLKDKNGMIKTFMLRRAAAKEAHQKNGSVERYKNGYIVKLNEEIEDVNKINRTNQKSIWQIREDARIGRESTASDGTGDGRTTSASSLITECATTEACSCSDEDAEKKTRKENVKTEAIDKGIETGNSMSVTGEKISIPMSLSKFRKVKK
jgi:dephospho-CoA kinase